MYIREPFPDEITSFDINGLYDKNSIVKHYKNILELPFTLRERSFLEIFRSLFISDLSYKNPLKDVLIYNKKS